ncbi:hypothetical protein EVAR_88841_1 [Eumeta japonica]|uniref:Uncharacterized protein n=1 Tax=Eumeta variegata TaxID=151549 RepID=A0A4C1Y7Z7_EUMVA|nr:hypothetical protein EVAR_88841_1 [Eumeta japonica]
MGEGMLKGGGKKYPQAPAIIAWGCGARERSIKNVIAEVLTAVAGSFQRILGGICQSRLAKVKAGQTESTAHGRVWLNRERAVARRAVHAAMVTYARYRCRRRISRWIARRRPPDAMLINVATHRLLYGHWIMSPSSRGANEQASHQRDVHRCPWTLATPEWPHQCVARFLEENKISNGGGLGLMEGETGSGLPEL